SDLLGRHRRRCIVQLSFFFLRRSFFVRRGERMRWTGQIFWLLALPSSRLHPPEFFGDWPNGKSYPVTAAQLLPSLTGFLAPIHFSKLAKNWIENYRLALQASRLFNHMPTAAVMSSASQDISYW